ncbi:MAG: signal peptidase II [Sedimentisphaerales bacterium]|nr:signal peptidase II [Sedimentisphaerales bacterium]
MSEPETEKSSMEAGSSSLSGMRRFISPDRLPSAGAQIVFWALFAGGLGLDLWSKEVVFDKYAYTDGLTVIDGMLRFVPVLNNGAAFGICAGQPFFLAAASIIATVGAVGYFYFSGIRHRLVQVALGILTAGICGNLYDRLFNGGLVRDFVDVYANIFGRQRHWHTFNVADALLCVGIGLLIIWTSLTGKSDQKPPQQRK